ncbi:Zn-dependent hydrolase, partial [Pseudomonas sp. SIMBA_068]
LSLHPGSRNVIPGHVQMTLDLSHLHADRLQAMVDEVRQVIEDSCRQHGLTFELTATADFPPLDFAPACVAAVRQGAEHLGLSHM